MGTDVHDRWRIGQQRMYYRASTRSRQPQAASSLEPEGMAGYSLTMEFGERVRRAARRKGLQEGELADRAGLSRSGLSKILNGHVVPRLDTVEAIVEALDMPLAEFFGGEKKRDPGQALMLLREDLARLDTAGPGTGTHEITDDMLARAIRIALRILDQEDTGES